MREFVSPTQQFVNDECDAAAPLVRISSPADTIPETTYGSVEPSPMAKGCANSTSAAAFPPTDDGRFLHFDHLGDSKPIDARPDQREDERR